MSDATNATGTAVSATPIETITIDPGPKATPPEAKSEGEPKWLPERLERERAKTLKEMGFESVDAAKAAAQASKDAAEAKKSDAERAASSKAALDFAQAENQKLTKAVATMAEATLKGLTDEQRAAVIEAAGEDPAAQIRTYNAFKGTWAAPAPAAATPPIVQPPPPNTMPTKGTPNDNGNAGSAPDPKAVYEELRKSNPYFAPRYAAQHGINTSA